MSELAFGLLTVVASAFLGALALGIAALTLVFIASAVIVVERFARMAARPLPVLVFVVLLSAIAAAVVVDSMNPEFRAEQGDGSWLSVFLPTWGSGALLVTLAVALGYVAVRFVSEKVLGLAGLILLGASLSLFTGSLDQFAYSSALPIGGALAYVGILWWTRGESESETSLLSEMKAPLVWLSLVFLAAPIATFVLEYPSPELQAASLSAGAAIFGFVLFGLLPLAGAGLLEMRRRVEWFIAVRYLVAKRRQVFISAITAICVAGIAAGVMLIVVVLSVMNGFEQTWRDEIVGNRAHFTVLSGLGAFEDYEDVRTMVSGVDGVTGVSPYLDAEGMVRGRGGSIVAVRLRGIDPLTVGTVTDLPSDIVAGSLDGLLPTASNESEPTDPGIVIGNQLAAAVGVGVGSEILLISPYGGPPTPLGPAPRLKRFQVVAVFESSFFQYDEVFTYTNLAAAQDFRRSGDVVDGLEAKTTDFYRSRRVADRVVDELDYPFFARDWKDYFPAFFQALKTERVMMFVLLTMIMVVAAFVIVATLIMMIMEKSSDIAILKAMGAEDSTIERIFAIEGTLIGLAGTALGILIGVVITHRLGVIQRTVEDVFGIDALPASIYQFSSLPSRVDPVQISIVAGIAMILSLGATLLPSRQGARLDPVEGLHHE